MIKGSKYRADQELLSRIKASLVFALIGMESSRYKASQGFGSRGSCVALSVKMSFAPIDYGLFDWVICLIGDLGIGGFGETTQ
jgi:hypothetical protein